MSNIEKIARKVIDIILNSEEVSVEAKLVSAQLLLPVLKDMELYLEYKKIKDFIDTNNNISIQK